MIPVVTAPCAALCTHPGSDTPAGCRISPGTLLVTLLYPPTIPVWCKELWSTGTCCGLCPAGVRPWARAGVRVLLPHTSTTPVPGPHRVGAAVAVAPCCLTPESSAPASAAACSRLQRAPCASPCWAGTPGGVLGQMLPWLHVSGDPASPWAGPFWSHRAAWAVQSECTLHLSAEVKLQAARSRNTGTGKGREFNPDLARENRTSQAGKTACPRQDASLTVVNWRL